MSLLFDQNLSAALVPRLQDLFPGCTHVKLHGLIDENDSEIWYFAESSGNSIVTKDRDFSTLLELRGHPPKVIWLRFGNAAKRQIERRLRAAAPTILAFLADPTEGLLELY